ncbi:MAG: hypothetical protein HXS54_06165 [Theionarchaea archaeon]|nr:hypothetical protein [Theionarchaea archaeon]DBA34843.1 TPA_asm: hypothetical protein vir521_00049 [Caudoviricetes sp. vir521]
MEKTEEEIEAIRRSVAAHNSKVSQPVKANTKLKEYYESDIFKEKREKFKKIKGGEKNDSED